MADEPAHFRLRLPADLKVRIEAAAAKQKRTINAEVVARLEQSDLLGFRSLPPDLVDRMLRAPFAKRRLAEGLIWDGILRTLYEHFPDRQASRRSIAALNDLFHEGLDRVQYDAPHEEHARLTWELVEELKRTAALLGVEWTPPDPDDAPF